MSTLYVCGRLRSFKLLQAGFFNINMPLLIQEGRGGGGMTHHININFTIHRHNKLKKKFTHAIESIRYLHQTHKAKYSLKCFK